jgi:hypothetical protein
MPLKGISRLRSALFQPWFNLLRTATEFAAIVARNAAIRRASARQSNDCDCGIVEAKHYCESRKEMNFMKISDSWEQSRADWQAQTSSENTNVEYHRRKPTPTPMLAFLQVRLNLLPIQVRLLRTRMLPHNDRM